MIGLEIYEREARIVRLIFKWYVQGDESGKPLTLWKIASKLTEMREPTPSQSHGYKTVRKLSVRNGIWNDASIAANIIANELYAGVWRYGRRIGGKGKGGRRMTVDQIIVNVPAIVDREMWEQAQAQRKHNAAMSKRNGKLDYLLRGLIKCSCGRNMTGQASGSSKTRGYRCIATSYLRNQCKERRINADYAEAYVWGCVYRKLSNLDELRQELKAAQAKSHEGDVTKRAELEAVNEMLEEVDREIDEFTALSKAGGRVGETFQKKVKDANARYAAHIKRRDKLTAELAANALTDDSVETILQFAHDVREGLDQATFDDKRRFLEMLKVKVMVKDGEIADILGVIEICTSQSGDPPRPNAPARAPRPRSGPWGCCNAA